MAGVRGKFGDTWEWEVAGLATRNRVFSRWNSFLTDQKLQDALSGRLGGYGNGFYDKLGRTCTLAFEQSLWSGAPLTDAVPAAPSRAVTTLAAPASTPARLLIVEDHPVTRDGLAKLLDSTPGFEVVGAVGDATGARARVAALRPELVLLDLMLGQGDGLALIGELTTAQPNLKILVVSMMSEAVYAERALRAGAVGYIMKTAETAEVILALNSVREGRVYLSGKIFVNVFRGLLRRATDGKMPGAEGLSDRELHVFQLIGAGVPNRDMATQLGISVKTVETHRENIKHKLGLSDTEELGAAARRFVDRLRD